MEMKSLRQAPIDKKTRVLLRADFDASLAAEKIRGNFRIQAVFSSLRHILKKGGLVRILSHVSRPKGKKNPKMSLLPVAKYLEKILRRKIVFVSDPYSEEMLKKYNFCPDILCFENLRFWPGEEANDKKFAETLAGWGDIYVNEAFANSHRNHASMTGLPALLPSFSGLNLEKEIACLDKLSNPKKPFVAILGGAKLETKLPLARKFLKKADKVIIGGAIANTIFHALGFETGKSAVEQCSNSGAIKDRRLVLPVDVLVASSLNSKKTEAAAPQGVKKDEYIVDIGPKSIELFKSSVENAKTVAWNGPLGYTPYYPQGTKALARKLAAAKAFVVVGGGDTVSELESYGISYKRFSHVSTGGGAMLEYLAGNKLPALEALKK